ncbi:PTR2 [Candida jiufengensis]|uniref:PTR2 n=1 Tax=Candida jiufengensis TaxID=497108 RepID=UPI0022245110|nr:PTR2 [Candida jiufengensis]KAI5950884.1 PTR2 [Candida jiufengensis]
MSNSSAIEPYALDEKSQQKFNVATDEESSGEIYNHDDETNYFPQYADEYNPRGYRKPTEHEEKTLRRVLGKFQYSIMLMCFVEFAERASYYSVTGILSNFIQRPLPKDSPHGWGAPPKGNDNASAGALNRGLQTASALTNLVTFLAYVVPLFGGYIADVKWSRWKTIQYGVVFGGISHVLFIVSAAPSLIENQKAGLAICILAIFTLAIGTGFIKPNLLPLMLDQYETPQCVKKLKSGEEVIIDREKTIESVTLVFYWAINIGAFFQLATSYCERRVGFWLAFFVPLILYLLMPIAFWIVKPKLKFEKPTGRSIITVFIKILTVALSGNFIKRYFAGTFWEYAKPTNMRARGRNYFNSRKQSPITWTDQDVLDAKQTVDACKIFFYFIFFNLADNGLGSAETSLIGAMTLDGVPNDLFNNFNPLAIIVLIPVLDYIVYPLLMKYRIPFSTIAKIAVGFIIAAMSQVAGAVLQHKVYQTSPCGNHSTNCESPAPISAWQASSIYILAGASEVFCMTTIYALAYTRAAPSMKGMTMALFLFTSAISAAISLAVTAALIDPYLIIVFGVIGGVSFLAGIVVYIQFYNLDKIMAEEEAERERMIAEEEHEEKSHIPETVLDPINSNNTALEPVVSARANLR